MKITNFLQKCIGISLVAATLLFGSAALVGTITPAKADNPTVINATGKIMMDQNTIVKDGKLYYHALVWDTETGKSKIYIFNNSTMSFDPTTYQLSSSPIY